MNKELLLKVADAIEANPEHFDMDDFATKSIRNTTACIAGWCVVIGKEMSLEGVAEAETTYALWLAGESRVLLGFPYEYVDMTDAQSELYDSLVFDWEWKNQDLKNAYSKAKTSIEKAKAAAEYVRWFVATDGGTNL